MQDGHPAQAVLREAVCDHAGAVRGCIVNNMDADPWHESQKRRDHRLDILSRVVGRKDNADIPWITLRPRMSRSSRSTLRGIGRHFEF